MLTHTTRTHRLMANVIDKATGKPLGGAQPALMLEWGGVRLGLMGEPLVHLWSGLGVGGVDDLLPTTLLAWVSALLGLVREPTQQQDAHGASMACMRCA